LKLSGCCLDADLPGVAGSISPPIPLAEEAGDAAAPRPAQACRVWPFVIYNPSQ
jgi:hypothetical protein